MLRKLLTLSLIQLCLSTVTHAADIRKENLGDVEGILGVLFAKQQGPEVTINPFLTSEEMYELQARAPLGAGGFDANLPLQVSHSALDRRSCPMLFLDQNFSFDQMKEFAQNYLGAKVRLHDVQRVAAGNKRMHCTFTEFEVLATRDEVFAQREEEQQAQQQKTREQKNAIHFEGDVTGTVHRLFPDWAHVSSITDGLPQETWGEYCGSRVTIEPAMDVQQMRAMRLELKKTGGRATLTNVKVANGKCTFEKIVPVN